MECAVWACFRGFWLFRAGNRLDLSCSFPKESEQYPNELRNVFLVSCFREWG